MDLTQPRPDLIRFDDVLEWADALRQHMGLVEPRPFSDEDQRLRAVFAVAVPELEIMRLSCRLGRDVEPYNLGYYQGAHIHLLCYDNHWFDGQVGMDDPQALACMRKAVCHLHKVQELSPVIGFTAAPAAQAHRTYLQGVVADAGQAPLVEFVAARRAAVLQARALENASAQSQGPTPSRPRI